MIKTTSRAILGTAVLLSTLSALAMTSPAQAAKCLSANQVAAAVNINAKDAGYQDILNFKRSNNNRNEAQAYGIKAPGQAFIVKFEMCRGTITAERPTTRAPN